MASRRPDGPHFLLLPYAAQGHINPMLSLASHLVALGCRVTFVKAEGVKLTSASTNEKEWSSEEEESEDQMLHFVNVEEEEHGGGLDKPSGTDHVSSEEIQEKKGGLESFKHSLGSVNGRQGRLVARLLRESGTSRNNQFSGIICDFFLWKWVSPLCRSHGVPLAVLHGCSATSFYVLYLQHKGMYGEAEDLLLSSFGLPTSKFFHDGLASSEDAPAVKEEALSVFLGMYEGFDEAGHLVLVNSFHHLEAPLLAHLEASPLKFAFFGPCFPKWNTERMARMAQQNAGCLLSEEQSCMVWLDKQKEAGSVLFVAFGSVVELKDDAQMEEIVAGIEKSGHKFLWIVRRDMRKGMLPLQAFRERIERREAEAVGMFVEWAPQKRVLQHPAVGGFLTHSGWNSTIESLTYGVPMLCLPFFLTQPLTANMVQWHWKVGTRLKRDAVSGMVGREEVERGVRSVMAQGRFTSPRIAEYQKAAEAAIADGSQRLVSFVRSIMTGTAMAPP